MPCTGPTAMGTKSCSRGTLTPPWYRGFQCCSQTDRKDRRCMTQCSCLGKDADTPWLKKNLTHKRHFQPTASSQRSASLGALNSQRLEKIISMLARRFFKEFYQVVHFFSLATQRCQCSGSTHEPSWEDLNTLMWKPWKSPLDMWCWTRLRRDHVQRRHHLNCNDSSRFHGTQWAPYDWCVNVRMLETTFVLTPW